MAELNLMRGFPPPPEMQVTLANWREPPYNRWAFRHVRQLVPSAPVPRGAGPAQPLPAAPRDLGPIAFADKEGRDGQVQPPRWPGLGPGSHRPQRVAEGLQVTAVPGRARLERWEGEWLHSVATGLFDPDAL